MVSLTRSLPASSDVAAKTRQRWRTVAQDGDGRATSQVIAKSIRNSCAKIALKHLSRTLSTFFVECLLFVNEYFYYSVIAFIFWCLLYLLEELHCAQWSLNNSERQWSNYTSLLWMCWLYVLRFPTAQWVSSIEFLLQLSIRFREDVSESSTYLLKAKRKLHSSSAAQEIFSFQNFLNLLAAVNVSGRTAVYQNTST